MNRVKQTAVASGVAVFLVALVSRPLLSNPATAGLLTRVGGLDETALLLVVPVLLTTLLVALRIRRLRNEESRQASQYDPARERRIEENHWDRDRRTDTDERHHQPDQEKAASDAVSQILGGQGGARDREFEVERQPPEADLGDHLEHLRAELDGEEAMELETLETVVEETDDGDAVPDRCPQPHCDAAWTEPGILDIKNGRYELLDDGQQVICLECEKVVTLA